MAQKAKTVVDTILGEALAGNWQDMLGVASVIDNRARATNVTPQDVVSAPGQFDAYGKSLPPSVDNYRDMAKQAIDHIREFGPVHNATFYSTPAAAKNLPGGLVAVTQTAGHQYFTDPQNRAIRTAQGYKRPDPAAIQTARVSLPDVGPMPESRPETVAYAPERDRAQFDTTPDTSTREPGLAGLSPSFNAGLQGTLAGFDRTGLSPSAAAMAAEMESMGFGDLGVNSGYRDPSRNARVGGARNSQHMRGNAIDLATKGLPDIDKSRVLDAALSAGARGIGAYPSGTIHVDTRAQPGFWGPNPRNPYAGVEISRMPGWAQEDLQALVDANGFGYLPSGVNNNVPTPQSSPISQTGMSAPVTPVERSALAGLVGVSAPTPSMQISSPSPRSITGNISMPTQGPSFAQSRQASPRNVSMTPDAIVSAPSFDPALENRVLDARATIGPALENRIREDIAQAATRAPAQTFDQAAFNAMTPAVSMPSAQPTFAPPMETIDDAKRAADKVARQNKILDNLEIAAAAQAAQPPQRAQAAPAPPSYTGQDVWSGRATSGVATNGNQMTRNPDGTVSMTSSKYGYTETMNPDGSYRSTTAPGLFGLDAAVNSALGGLLGVSPSSQPVSANVIDNAVSPQNASRKGLSSLANKGALKGGVIGAAVGGPIVGGLAALLGGVISRQRARQQDPRNIFNASYQAGLAFPEQPTGASSQGGLTAYGEAASRGEFGGQAQGAANNPGGGLY